MTPSTTTATTTNTNLLELFRILQDTPRDEWETRISTLETLLAQITTACRCCRFDDDDDEEEKEDHQDSVHGRPPPRPPQQQLLFLSSFLPSLSDPIQAQLQDPRSTVLRRTCAALTTFFSTLNDSRPDRGEEDSHHDPDSHQEPHGMPLWYHPSLWRLYQTICPTMMVVLGQHAVSNPHMSTAIHNLILNTLPHMLSISSPTIRPQEPLSPSPSLSEQTKKPPSTPTKNSMTILPFFLERLQTDKNVTIRESCAIYVAILLRHAWPHRPVHSDSPPPLLRGIKTTFPDDWYHHVDLWIHVLNGCWSTRRDPSPSVRHFLLALLQELVAIPNAPPPSPPQVRLSTLLQHAQCRATKDSQLRQWLIRHRLYHDDPLNNDDGDGDDESGALVTADSFVSNNPSIDTYPHDAVDPHHLDDDDDISILSKQSYNSDTKFRVAALAQTTHPNKLRSPIRTSLSSSTPRFPAQSVSPMVPRLDRRRPTPQRPSPSTSSTSTMTTTTVPATAASVPPGTTNPDDITRQELPSVEPDQRTEWTPTSRHPGPDHDDSLATTSVRTTASEPHDCVTCRGKVEQLQSRLRDTNMALLQQSQESTTVIASLKESITALSEQCATWQQQVQASDAARLNDERQIQTLRNDLIQLQQAHCQQMATLQIQQEQQLQEQYTLLESKHEEIRNYQTQITTLQHESSILAADYREQRNLVEQSELWSEELESVTHERNLLQESLRESQQEMMLLQQMIVQQQGRPVDPAHSVAPTAPVVDTHDNTEILAVIQRQQQAQRDTEMAALTVQVEELQSLLSTKEEVLAEVTNQLEALSGTNAELRDAARVGPHEQVAESHSGALELEVSHLTTTLEDVRNELRQCRTEHELQCDVFQSELEGYRKRVELLDTEKSSMEEQLDDKTNAIHDLERKVDETKVEVDQERGRADVLQNDLTSLHREMMTSTQNSSAIEQQWQITVQNQRQRIEEMESQCQDLTLEVERYRASADEAASDKILVHDLLQEKTKLLVEKDDLLVQLSDLESLMEQSRYDTKQERDNVQILEDRLKSLRLEMDEATQHHGIELQSETARWTDRVVELEAQCLALTSEMDQYRKLAETARTDTVEMEQLLLEKERLIKVNGAIIQRLKEMEDTMHRSQQDAQVARQRSELLEHDLATLQQVRDDLESELRSTQLQLAESTNQMQKWNELESKCLKLTCDVSQYQSLADALEAEKESTFNELQSLQQKFDESESNGKMLQTRLDDLQQRYAEQSSIHDDEIRQLRASHAMLQDQVDSSSKERDRLLQQIRQLQEGDNIRTEIVKQLEQQSRDLVAAAHQAQQDSEIERKRAEEFSIDLSSIRQELIAVTQIRDEVQAELGKSTAKLVDVEHQAQRMVELESKCLSLTVELENVQMLTKKLDSDNDYLRALESEKSRLMRENEEITAQAGMLRQKVDNCEETEQALKKEVDRARALIDTTNQAKQDAEEYRRRADELNEEIAMLKTELENMTCMRNDLRSEVEDLNIQLSEIQNQQQRMEELETKCLSLSSEVAQFQMLSDAYEHDKSYLQELETDKVNLMANNEELLTQIKTCNQQKDLSKEQHDAEMAQLRTIHNSVLEQLDEVMRERDSLLMEQQQEKVARIKLMEQLEQENGDLVVTCEIAHGELKKERKRGDELDKEVLLLQQKLHDLAHVRQEYETQQLDFLEMKKQVQQMNELEFKVGTMSSEVEQFEALRLSLDEELEKLTGENAKLKEKNAMLSDQLNVVTKQINLKEIAERDLETELNATRAAMVDQNKHHADSVEQLQTEQVWLREQLENFTKDRDVMVLQEQERDKRELDLQSRIERLQLELQQTASKLQVTETELKSQTSVALTFKESTVRIQELEAMLQQRNVRVEEFDQRIEHLTTTLTQARKLPVSEEDLLELQEQVDALNEALQHTRSRLVLREADLEQLHVKVNEIRNHQDFSPNSIKATSSPRSTLIAHALELQRSETTRTSDLQRLQAGHESTIDVLRRLNETVTRYYSKV